MTEDDERFELLFNANYGGVLAYALRRCSSRQDAEDVVAETFAVAWRRLNELPEGDEARLWLFGTARLVWTNRIRGNRRQRGLLDRLRRHARQSQTPDVDAVLVANERLRKAIAALRETDREILRLHAWEDLTAEQIAITLEISTPAAWKRLQRARDRLAAHMAASDEGFDGAATSPVTAGKVIR